MTFRRALPLLALLAAAAAPAARAQQDTSVTEVVVEVKVAGGPSATLIALARDSVLLLPARGLLELLAIRISETLPGRRLAAVLEPGDTVFTFDTERGLYSRGKEEAGLDPRRAFWRGEELFVESDLIAQVLGVTATTDWGELTLTLGDTERLPVVSRTVRTQRRSALLRGDARQAEGTYLPRARTFADGAVVDWSFTSATRDPVRSNSLQLGFGAEVLGGSLELQHTIDRAPVARDTVAAAGTRVRTSAETRWQWVIAWPLRGWLRQMRVGEVTTGARRPVPVRGAVVTNAPYLRESVFGSEVFSGRLAPGWEVESLRGDQLLAFAAADSVGRYRLGVPVSYGPNPLDLVAYGPQGQRVRLGRTVVVPNERVPAGRFEYTLGGGECQASLCRTAVQGDVRYGLSRHITMQAGADVFVRDSLRDLRHPWALATVAPAPSLNLTVEAVGRGFVRGRADYDPSPDLHLDVAHARNDTTVVSPIVGSAAVRDQTEGTLFWRPLGPRSALYLQGSASRAAGAGTVRDRARLGATGRLLGVRVVVAAERFASRSAGAPTDLRSTAEAALDGQLWGTFLRVQANGECAADLLRCPPRVARYTATASRRILHSIQASTNVRWLRGQRGVTVDFTLSSTAPGVRWVSRNAWDRAGGVQGTQSLEGSVLWDQRAGRLSLGNGRNLGRGGLAGEVFEDRNADGIRQPDEPAISDILLRVGSYTVRTDTGGHFSVYDLVPFEPVAVEVDSLALDNPLWVPADPLVLVSPAPNAFGFVSIGILNGGEVSGTVTFGEATRGLGGIPVRFRHILTGSVRAARTFSDGTFYVGGLRPGAYDLEIPADVLARLQATAAPTRISLGPTEGENRLDGVTVRLQRARP